MSTNYKESDKIPTSVLCARLDELSTAVTKGRDGINREFLMSIPAELDRDADLVISESSRRLMSTIWISVEDRLPENGDQVLGYYTTDVGDYEGQAVVPYLLMWLIDEDCTITHWMPLPDKPES